MGKLTRRGAIAASIAASSLLIAPLALADDQSPVIDADGNVVIDPAGGVNFVRFADRDRVGTAIEAAERTNNIWGSTVILASSSDAHYADALASAPLADVLDAPVLLTAPGDEVDSRVIDYLNENNVENVLIVSGTQVLRAGVVEELMEDADVTVERVAGANRYATAVAIGAETVLRGGGEDNLNVFVADGTNFPDALAAGATAAQYNGIVLLTKGGELEAFTAGSLGLVPPVAGTDTFSHSEIIAVGGKAAQAVRTGYMNNSFDESITVSHVGADRYETAVMLAEEYFDDSKDGVTSEPDTFAVASGQISADAVVAGAWAANVDGPLLLTRNASLSAATAEYLGAEVNSGDTVAVFGGTGSVSVNVTNQLRALFVY